jgi:lysophospholipase L1-like esterase
MRVRVFTGGEKVGAGRAGFTQLLPVNRGRFILALLPMKRLLLFLTLALCTAAFAEDKPATAPASDALKIAIIGDSTVCEYPADSPSRGWGHYLPDYFKEDVKFVNLAKGGRSTKTFIAEGLWDKTIAEKPQYIFIQFGHNDSHDPAKPEATNAATDYPDFLRRYIDEARAIGAKPILVTPMVRRNFRGAVLADILTPYADAMKAVAAEKKVPLIDLHASSARLVTELGEEKSMEFANAPTDHTHFNEKGAKAMAELIMKELPTAVPELQPYLRK